MQRTYRVPRYADEWSFSGLGRARYQRIDPHPTTGILAADPAQPPRDVDVEPKEPRG